MKKSGTQAGPLFLFAQHVRARRGPPYPGPHSGASDCERDTRPPRPEGAAPCPPRCGPRGRRYRARHPPTQINVLPGIGSARPSTHPAGPPHTVRAVCGAAYPHKGGRRFGHPGGGAVLMLPQGPAGQRTVRLAPPSKKARPSPSGADVYKRQEKYFPLKFKSCQVVPAAWK